MGLRRARQPSPPQPTTRRPVGIPILGYTEARRSPCDGCEAWCCTYLSLPEFTVSDLEELDWAVYLLNFDGIRVTLTRSGRWIPYWRGSCRHFDEDSRRCKVHGTDLQPHTCARYNPFTCHYKVSFPEPTDDDMMWLDRRRMALFLTGVQVDDRREAVTMPPFDTLQRIFETMPPDDGAGDPDPPHEAPEPPVKVQPTRIPLSFDHPGVSTPCEGCAAYCCTRLVVPLDPPADATIVDYLRYALGFPGVELVVGDGRWGLALETTCRHLDGTRCAIFGSDERPIRCEYYDAWNCSYRDTFAPDRQGDVRLSYEDVPALISCCEFDDRGRLLSTPTPDDLAAALAAG